MNLRTPGPTPLPQVVLDAMTKDMVDHRGKEFAEIIQRSTDRLKRLFKTEADVFILTTSGTGAMETAIVNTISPGDRVLAVSNGSFGDRFAEIARIYGADVVRLDFEWGRPIEADKIADAIKADPTIKAVLVIHNETSTGLTNDIEPIGKAVRAADRLFIVDAISSIGSIPLPVDEWCCDVMVTGSQKSFMIPPGLAMISFNDRAWKAYETSTAPKYYFDIRRAKTYLNIHQTPWTPAVSLFYALDVALDLMEKEGLENIFERQRRVGQRTRDGIRALGLNILPLESHASNTVTAVVGPPGVNISELRAKLRDEHGVVLAGGQGKLDGKIFRIGHLGYVDIKDIDEVLVALVAVLPQVGFTGPQVVMWRSDVDQSLANFL